MQTASMTVMTRSGGLVNTLISEMSALSRELRASLATFRAGRASSRSRWASAAMAWVSSAFTLARDSSSDTTLRTYGAERKRVASLGDDTQTLSAASTSMDFCFSTGSRADSSTFMVSTSSLVSSSLVMPFFTRSRA
ncbi:hypothetical protein EYF80_046928 [Liparis tanakae]|uniref:Uncharacterized protein n=1 Tax=Liparis tanakae TaxID=230148 RepID=A0A4Z2FPB9_9TELE|nr:hypothetical protein EYF80_046928 [Liparis tanakae]